MKRGGGENRDDREPPKTGGGRSCPICNTPVTDEQATYPFCSKRCRLVDLGEWFDGSYRVARPFEERDL